MATTTRTGRPALSDIAGFWTAPITERAAVFAGLREREPVSFHPQPVLPHLPPGGVLGTDPPRRRGRGQP